MGYNHDFEKLCHATQVKMGFAGTTGTNTEKQTDFHH